MVKAILLLLGVLPLCAQSGGSFWGRFSLGVTGGLPLNTSSSEFIAARYHLPGLYAYTPTADTTRRFTVGPNLEFALTDHVSLQFNPLYRRYRSDQPFVISPLLTGDPLDSTKLVSYNSGYGARTATNAWEFPFIAKYYFGRPGASWRFFAGTGYSFALGWRHESGTILSQYPPAPPTVTPFNTSYRLPTQSGGVFSGGVAWKKGRMVIAPELRYTRWIDGGSQRPQNQFDLLLNLRF
jgi:Outer membrane protein beta-barrel domain